MSVLLGWSGGRGVVWSFNFTQKDILGGWSFRLKVITRFMYVGVSDKLLMPWLKGKKYTNCSDEGEAIGIAGGYWLATGERATVFMSADGFCNAMNPLTSWIIPYGLEMNLVISVGRTEPQHVEMSRILRTLLAILQYDPKKLSVELIEKES